MISAVIATLNHEAVLGRALSPLVSAAVSGLLTEVIVSDGGSIDATLDIADDAGATILTGSLEGRLERGCAAARGSWLLLLDPLAWLEPAWQEAARSHIEALPGKAAWFPPASEGMLGRWTGPRGFKALLTPRRLMAEALNRPASLRPRRLDARIFPAEAAR